MKLNWTLQKIAKITNGELQTKNPDTVITSFVTDSRIVTKGDGFIALKGARFDARQFIPDVLKKGAAVHHFHIIPKLLHNNFRILEK